MSSSEDEKQQLAKMRSFYDSVYYRSVDCNARSTPHLRRLAAKLGIAKDDDVLDVACGAGHWLSACREQGARVSGVDLSTKAIEVCKSALAGGEFYATEAESLPFADARFDVVTCLGSLEHFIDPVKALREMGRVAKREARFVLLVPNADFLTRRLGLFSGTQQVDAKEEVRTIPAWRALFEQAGLQVEENWADLHVLSWDWISGGPWYRIPLRAAQALALAVWPLKWQYQVYFRCRKV
jgi:ubiquinone/menaquinone biosynthesis C-methylase UbiE